MALEPLERFAHRFDELVDGLLPLVEVAARRCLEAFQRGAGQFEEGRVVALQRLGREGLEGVGEFLLRLPEHLQLVLRGLAFLAQRRLQAGQLRLRFRVAPAEFLLAGPRGGAIGLELFDAPGAILELCAQRGFARPGPPRQQPREGAGERAAGEEGEQGNERLHAGHSARDRPRAQRRSAATGRRAVVAGR